MGERLGPSQERSMGKQGSQEKKSVPVVKVDEPFKVTDFVETEGGAKSEFDVKLEGRDKTKLAIILKKSTLPIKGSELERTYALFGPVSARIMSSSNQGNLLEISNVLAYEIRDRKGWDFNQSRLEVFIDGDVNEYYPHLEGHLPSLEKMKDKTKYWRGERWVNGYEWARHSSSGVSSRIAALPKPNDLQKLTFVFKVNRTRRY